MKIRISLLALCALSVLACDDNAAGPGLSDLGSTRDRGVLAPGDSDIAEIDAAPDPDDGVPLLEPEPSPEPEPNPEPEPDPEPEPGPEPGGDCAEGETRVCVESCGVASCVDGRFGPCQAVGELCNDHDDNCNGTVDEGYAGLGVGCVVDQNGCSSNGVRVCGADQRSVICEAPPAVPSPEVCDGDDDDCDGNVDEDFPGRTCCADDLQCGPGQTCENGECTGGGGPGPGDQCVDDFDCFFQTCVQGVCRDLCLFDEDCGPGEFCDFGACMPGGQPMCVDDFDCPIGQACQNGQCVPDAGPACIDDADCPGQQTCQNGVCALPPGVGSCDATVVIPGFGAHQGSNVGGFDSLASSCGPADDGPEQVFELTLDANARVTVDTNGTDFDTVLNVLGACPGAELACDDDGGDGLQSQLTFDAVADTTYFIVVNGYGDASTGAITLNVAGVEICVADAECPAGQACIDGACAVPPCVANAECPDGQLCRAGDCVPADEPLCRDDADCNEFQQCADRVCVLRPGAGSCDLPVVMDGFGQYQGSNVDLPNSIDAGCIGADGGEQVFEFTLDANTRVSLDTNGSSFDTVLTVNAGCPGDELACDDDGGDGTRSAVTFDAMAGVTYYAVVHGFSANSTGDIVINFAGVEICLADGDCPGDQICTADGTCEDPPPPLCGDAIEMDGFGDYVGSNVGRLDEVDGSCGAADEGAEVVFSFQLDGPTDVVLDTSGTGFDTVLSVWADCNAADVACDDDGGEGATSRVEFRAEAGVRYFVVAEGYFGGEGDVLLSYTGDVLCQGDADCPGDNVCDAGACVPPPPAGCDDMCGGDCANAICIPAVPAACAGATLADAVPGAWQGNTVGLVNQHDSPCGNSGASPDDILVVAFPVDTVVTASTAGSGFDTILYVLEACDPANSVACNDDAVGLQSEVTFDAVAGVAYYIVVDGFNGAEGAFELAVDTQ